MIELFAALVLAAGSPAAAGAATEAPPQAASADVTTQAATPPAAADKAKPKVEKVVCHLEPELGSHFSRKICVSARTAGERSQDDRDALHDIQDHASSPSYH